MDDLISRQAAIDYVDCGHLRPPTELAWSDLDVVTMLERLPSAEITLEQVKAYCEPRCLSVVTNELVRYWEDETKYHNADELHKHYEHYHGMENLLAEPQERKTEKALRLLLEWAIECDFGYDNIPEEYEKYKDDIEGMSYTDGLIYIARMEVDNE